MNCNQAKHQLALRVGHDLDPQAEHSVERHLTQCPHCRAHWRELKGIAAVLRQVSLNAADVPRPSVLPFVCTRLPAGRAAAGRHDVGGWFPVGALAAACVAVIVFSSSTPMLNFEREVEAPPLAHVPRSAAFPQTFIGSEIAPVGEMDVFPLFPPGLFPSGWEPDRGPAYDSWEQPGITPARNENF